ncbi:MAG: hypothetical protein PHP08_00510 [Candidatus Dojkabacteria bacterium]|nr:hypothetical protein [Candidatus Dojkabacteria bacterium]
MKITRSLFINDTKNTEMIEMDENDEFVKIDDREYVIHLSSSEHREISPDILERHVAKAIIRGIDVYFAYSNVSKFIICGLDLASSQESVVVFSTSDTSKFGLLDSCVKEFVKDVKKTIKEKKE